MDAVTYTSVHQAIATLRSPDHREESEQRLAEIGEEAVAPLCLALESPNRETLLGALHALGAIGDTRALASLARVARHEAAAIAIEAVDAIAAIGSILGVQQLTGLLACELREIRLKATLGLARIAASSALVDAAAARRALADLPTDGLAEFSQACLWQLDTAPRTLGIQAALSQDPHRVVAALLQALSGDNTSRASASQQAIRDVLGHVAAVEPLVERLAADPAPWLVHLAGQVGSALPESRERTRLIAAVVDLYLADRIAIGNLIATFGPLGEMGTNAVANRLPKASAEPLVAIVDLLDALEWTPTSDYRGVRYAVAKCAWHTCVELGTRSIPALIEAFDRADAPPIRRDIAQALWDLGWQPDTRLQRVRMALALSQWSEFEGIGHMGGREVRAVRRALSDEITWSIAYPKDGDAGSIERRIAFLHFLYGLRGGDVYPGLADAAYRDPSPRVRDVALGLLTRGGTRFRNDLTASLAEARAKAVLLARASDTHIEGQDTAATFRQGLIQSLAAQRSPDTIEALIATLVEDPAPIVRQTAGSAIALLAERHRDMVIQALVGTLDRPTTRELGATLRRIGEPMQSRLFALIDCPEGAIEPQRIARGKNGLLAMLNAGANLRLPLRQPLLSGSAVARQVVTELYDAMGIRPDDPAALAAYWIARREPERCLILGQEAVPAICDALPLYDWRMAGRIVQVLIRLGVDADLPELARTITKLTEMARTPDLDTQQGIDAERASLAGHPISLRRIFAGDRRDAQHLLRDITQAQAEYLVEAVS